MPKSMTLRLDDEKARELEAVARADDTSVSEAVRSAIDHHIAQRRADEEFQSRLRRLMEDEREVLERLARS
jgi:predicted transcriptional regulator